MPSVQHFDLVIKNGACVIPQNAKNYSHCKTEVYDIGIVGQKIEKIGSIHKSRAKWVVDAKGLHVLPGIIDSQVHFREPGDEHKEDLFTGTQSAALGGVTTVFDMPNTHPPTVSQSDLQDKIARTHNRIWVNCGFFVGATVENISDLSQLENLPGCAGIKMFMGLSTGDLVIRQKDHVEQVICSGRRRMAIHAEDNERLEERKKILDKTATVHCHPQWRDEPTALIATQRAVSLAEKHKRPIHILHVSSQDEVQFLADHKNGLISVECTPQHLTLFAPDCYDALDTYAQMNPPIRHRTHFLALWQAVINGIIDVIGSDHAPHTHDEKKRKYPNSPSGMPGVQTLVPMMLDHVNQKRLPLEKLVPLISTNPAKLFGLKNKGVITEGFDADLTLVDLKCQRIITNEWIASKCQWTPFHGRQVTGWPMATIVNGHLVMKEGKILDSPHGQVVNFDIPEK